MAHFCGFIKLIFLLLMLARIPFNETRPLKGKSQTTSDLIAGNEFLKLFMEHDQLDRDNYSSDYGGGSEADFDKKSAETGRRASGGRSLKDKGPKLNQAEGQFEDSKQVVKLVTSGSKIVFLEDYDESNDAILDAEARDIDLKRETFKQKTQQRDIKTNFDDYKVVAVSVSSSSQRGTTTARNRLATTAKTPTTTSSTTTATTKATPTTRKTNKYDKLHTTIKPIVTMTPKPPTVTTTVRTPPSSAQTSSTRTDSLTGDNNNNFINRSHKSEFSIEEVEPLTMTQQHKSRKLHSRQRSAKFPITSVADTLEALDSENSASTNIHNVLAAPLQQSASARSTSMVTSTYHSSQRNVSINHDSNLHASKAHKTVVDDSAKVFDMPSTLSQEQSAAAATVVEDQLLPFQTVIYHDTKAGHGPQSRSISYSSISQNVEDLKKWQQTGILAEARRNVSESLKPMTRRTITPANHQSEPSKFYSQPSKMYSEPSKFYSEPAKVYSEPAKVYGEPEKFYSEPSKVYGQPSKFYSEPSKVYSQPAKVYSEPAKTYWPLLTSLTTTSSSYITTTLTPPTIAPQITTIIPPSPSNNNNNVYQSSRKPAIVSRIAFGENHSTTTTTTTTTTPSPPITTTTTKSYGSHINHQHSRTYGQRHNPSSSSSSSSNNENSSTSSTPSRRILFNLDRLPYDLLNAPEPSNQQQLLELQKSKRPPQRLTYQQHQQQQQQQQQQQRHHINPCLESAVSTLFSSSTLSAHPALQKQRQQQLHSSLSDQQHSNQNAKGLPNGDLVKCVAEISHTSSSAAGVSNDEEDDNGEVESFTTERSHIEELFTPTPEQNYEIEESVSVMTNGRAHGGMHGGSSGRNSLALPTTSPIHQQQHHGFQPTRQRTRIHFGTNVNNPVEIVNGVSTNGGGGGGVHGGGHHLSQSSYNTNANANAETNRNTHDGNTSPDYNNYDDNDGNNDDNGGGDDDDGSPKHNDYDSNDDNGDDEDNGTNKNTQRHNNAASVADNGRGSPHSNNNGGGGGGDDDDSKVAYVVEGRNYRKYRVEEKTDDGFIVGEYGVVDHNDGNLRGVRYTADSTINRSLIQKALLTFLKLK